MGILLDLQGPKIRVGSFEEKIPLKAGQTIGFYREGSQQKPLADIVIPVPASTLDPLLHSNALALGHRIKLDDGNVTTNLINIEKEKQTLVVKIAQVPKDYVLKQKKGMNFPDSRMAFGSITQTDKENLEAGLLRDTCITWR